MTTYFRASWILTCLMTLVGAGCCCTQGMNTCNSYSSCSSCPTGGCGGGPLMGMASCRGGCGETYVDEWVSEPPCIDDCGYCNSGCDMCQRRPLRSTLRMLWGIPYKAVCGCGGSGCSACSSSGCSSCEGGFMAGSGPMHNQTCNCGGSHAESGMHSSSMPTQWAPTHAAPSVGSPAPAASAPTPAPVAPSSAKRLSPAQQKTTIARASTR